MNAVKAVIMGEGGVGKTTLVNLLQGKIIDEDSTPTIGVCVEKVLIGDNKVAVWDLGGQKRFQFMWQDFLKGAGLTILVTDSSEKNVKETKYLLEKYNRNLGSKVIAIANKQDLPNRLAPEKIQQELGVPTYGMVAIDKKNFTNLFKILNNHL